MSATRPIRIANCSGFFGDRLSAAFEMVHDGPIDFLTGDYLAELTMALLWRSRRKHPDRGYAHTFLTQMEQVMADCLAKGIRVVVNAGGLNPSGMADELKAIAARVGVKPTVASVDGDDLMNRIAEVDLRSARDNSSLAGAGITPVTANVYLGCWGIVEALDRGADIVVTGRVTDASLVMGPAAHHHGWERDDWDRLAGALVAGHVIECGAQTTGGNYSFFQEVPNLERVGFPLVEMNQDGSFVVTKHPGTGGLVSEGTVTAQLLYEVGGHRYLNPDVTARFDTISLDEVGPDRVEVTGVKGEPPPERLKVAVNYLGGYQNRVTFVLTGLDIEDKATVAETALWTALDGSDSVESAHVELIRWDRADPASNNAAMAQLRVTVQDPDADRVGRRFSAAAIELALASYPGFFVTEPPRDATPFVVYWPATVDRDQVSMRVNVDGNSAVVPAGAPAISDVHDGVHEERRVPRSFSSTVRLPLGRVVGARSGDKGGDANVGIWAGDETAFDWLDQMLTTERFRALFPETEALVVERHRFANLKALNFVIRGLLGQGVSSSPRFDPQAKSLGEYVRSRVVDVPNELLEPATGTERRRDAGTISSG